MFHRIDDLYIASSLLFQSRTLQTRIIINYNIRSIFRMQQCQGSGDLYLLPCLVYVSQQVQNSD